MKPSCHHQHKQWSVYAIPVKIWTVNDIFISLSGFVFILDNEWSLTLLIVPVNRSRNARGHTGWQKMNVSRKGNEFLILKTIFLENEITFVWGGSYIWFRIMTVIFTVLPVRITLKGFSQARTIERVSPSLQVGDPHHHRKGCLSWRQIKDSN